MGGCFASTVIFVLATPPSRFKRDGAGAAGGLLASSTPPSVMISILIGRPICSGEEEDVDFLI